ncbi:DUF3106 domain-containing protein [Ottowia sp. GY511]|uniref:DUF3106 domain-containing protein n=1 Tax=Ottowia flava TaxID=2675430 RepID=A0ABW4KSI3_9BURK|nr:DUF3106 domain-containing protein [Ottowia sp. GY511]TXK33428.1 DUF3106 domain-containing protein [Ottowia sp. GY511]
MRLALPFFLLLTLLASPPVLAQSTQPDSGALPVAGSLPWSSLSAEQKSALKPLASQWRSLGADHQRKWIAVTHNFNRMTGEEQETLQGRMSEWAQLTPAQRTQARMNFYEVRRVPADEKRAKWEEYQALPPEERERLAGDRPKPPAGVAPALRPAPRNRILRPGEATAQGPAKSPATLRAPANVNRNTLLPQPPASAVKSSR